MKTEPSWKWRRIVVFAVTAWSCFMLYRLMTAADTNVNQTIAYGLIMLVGVIVCGYLGFATVQDVAAIWKTGRAMPYVPDPPVEPDQRSYQPPYTDPPR